MCGCVSSCYESRPCLGFGFLSLAHIFFSVITVVISVPRICLKHFLHFSVLFMRIPLHLVMCGNV